MFVLLLDHIGKGNAWNASGGRSEYNVLINIDLFCKPRRQSDALAYQSRNSSLIPVFARVCASTVFTITAQ
jgi:hypothetical protein